MAMGKKNSFPISLVYIPDPPFPHIRLTEGNAPPIFFFYFRVDVLCVFAVADVGDSCLDCEQRLVSAHAMALGLPASPRSMWGAENSVSRDGETWS